MIVTNEDNWTNNPRNYRFSTFNINDCILLYDLYQNVLIQSFLKGLSFKCTFKIATNRHSVFPEYIQSLFVVSHFQTLGSILEVNLEII